MLFITLLAATAVNVVSLVFKLIITNGGDKSWMNSRSVVTLLSLFVVGLVVLDHPTAASQKTASSMNTYFMFF